MAFHTAWLNGEEIVAKQDFDDLLEAQAFVLEHMKEYQDSIGAKAVKVWDDHIIYFQVEAGGSQRHLH
jgi:hypothetical protein